MWCTTNRKERDRRIVNFGAFAAILPDVAVIRRAIDRLSTNQSRVADLQSAQRLKVATRNAAF